MRGFRFLVRVGMDLINNIINFVSKILERFRRTVSSSCEGLHMILWVNGLIMGCSPIIYL